MTLDPGRAVERNLLACMLSSAVWMERVDVPPAAFESEAIRTTYSVICDLKKLGHEEISLNTLRMHFDSRPDFAAMLERAGGAAFLDNLASKPDLPNAQLHLEQLKKRFAIRQAKNRAADALEAVLEGEFENPEQLYEVLDDKLISADEQDVREIFRSGDFSKTWLEEQADLYLRGGYANVGHPIYSEPLAEAFEDIFTAGGLYVWSGETNVGKSMVVQMLNYYQGIKGNIPTLNLDNELSLPEFRARTLARISNVPLRRIIGGQAFNPRSEDYEKLQEAVEELDGRNIIEWRKMLDMSIERIDPIVRRFLRQHEDKPHKQLIVDGIKLNSEGDSFIQVGFFAQRLKTHIASRYASEGLVVHATCQLNRHGNSRSVQKEGDKHADHNSIGLSKLIADNADDVIILSKHFDPTLGEFDPAKRRIYITKARNHATLEGSSYLLCDFAGALCRLEPKCIVSPGSVGPTTIEEMTAAPVAPEDEEF